MRLRDMQGDVDLRWNAKNSFKKVLWGGMLEVVRVCCSSWLGWVWFGRWKRIVRCTAIALGYPTILNAPFNRNRFWLLQKDVSRRWEGCDQNSMELDSWWQRHKFG